MDEKPRREPTYKDQSVRIYQGDVRQVLCELPNESVNCCVTSPPYWGLRDYGVKGQIGLEDSPVKYVSAMRGVFAEVRRVLRDDGTLWLNMGDSYHNGDKGGYAKDRVTATDSMQRSNLGANFIGAPNRQPIKGLKPKDLVGVPWMLAFALREDGWWLRQDIIWSKPNPMPESVTDRCTKAHEYIFLLSKSERYYFNQEAIKEESVSCDPRKPYAPGQVDNRGNGHDRGGGAVRKVRKPAGWDTSTGNGGHGNNHKDGRAPEIEYAEVDATKRNRRSVWEVTTEAFPEAHFATFPQELIKPCILAGCPEGGTVLDPFMGSGTTGLVAKSLHCKAIGIELNLDYIRIAEKRLRQEVMSFPRADSGGVGPRGALFHVPEL